MAQRTVPPEKVKTLANWVARWPKATNLGFDPETREATIYDTTKERNKVSSIPWKREADTLTVLAQPSRFTPQAVAAATSRFDKIREQRNLMRAAGEEQLRLATAAVLEAWRAYEGTPVPALRRDILSAEKQVRELEAATADKERTIIKMEDPNEPDTLLQLKSGIYIPPMPVERRGISLVGSSSET